MPRAIPPLDLVARALSVRGATRQAISLLELLVAQPVEERARSEALLASLRATPEAVLSAPGVRLDVDLVEAIATHGRLQEALIVAIAIDARSSVLGLEIVQALEAVLAPIAPEEPSDVVLCYRDGLGGSAIAAQRVVLAPNASPAIKRRAQVLVQRLRGFRGRPPVSAPALTFSVDPAVVNVVGEMLSRRDLAWGRRALELLVTAAGGRELYESVDLLVRATDSFAQDDVPGVLPTTPFQGSGVALLQIRMVNLDQAEGALRRVCVESPDDTLAPRLLAAVSSLRAVAEISRDEPSQDATPPRAPTPEWLNKRSRRASVEGWSSSKRASEPVPEAQATTGVLRPDDEAELHLRAGRPDKAIALYQRLAARFPDHPRFAERAAEIQAQVDARAMTFADEVTVRRDVGKLASFAIRSQERPLDPVELEGRRTIEMASPFETLADPSVLEAQAESVGARASSLTPPAASPVPALPVPAAPGPAAPAAVAPNAVAVRPIIGIG
ncbi:MAG: tetratricopeptide repeat protein [Deltaproteobacteria bacterium]